ncbi:hypothetical protein Pla52nx_003875 [Stieleria varia]|uniref:Group II intron, maturase-specific domain n=1 Tax=Stieleria varia TaxID=2528005 RepID=A0A5C6AWM5_9BACT|nr:hypothetical protein Pla52n_24660 [Stieleria varia]
MLPRSPSGLGPVDARTITGHLKSRWSLCHWHEASGEIYVGYEFRGFGGPIRVSKKKLLAFKKRVCQIFRRNRGVSMKPGCGKQCRWACPIVSLVALR